MSNDGITLRNIGRFIGEWLEAAVEWGIETFNRVIDADLTFIFQMIGVLRYSPFFPDFFSNSALVNLRWYYNNR